METFVMMILFVILFVFGIWKVIELVDLLASKYILKEDKR